MSKILPLIAGGADPAGVAGNAILFSKVSGGVTQLFSVASDGTVTQLTPAASSFTPDVTLADNTTSVIGAPVYSPALDLFELARANAPGTSEVIGLALFTTGAAGIPGLVRTMGPLTLTTAEWDAITGQAGGLTAIEYYLSTATPGRLQTTAPVVVGQTSIAIGRGISATTMIINIQPSVLL